MVRMLLAICLLLHATAGVAMQVAVPADVPADVLGDYQRWLQDRDVLALKEFSGPGVRRDVVELALFQQALASGCGAKPIEWVTVDSYPRTLSLLRERKLDAAATSMWLSDLRDADLGHSAAVIDDGEFVAALYASEDKPLVIRSVADLAAVRVVSSPHWPQDWAVLQRIPFATVYAVNDWATMVRWVASDKADVLLAPMSAGEPAHISVEQVKLVAVQGVRIALQGSRHFGFSVGSQHVSCFDRGLLQLEQRGTVRSAYEAAGFWRPEFMAWPILLP